MHSVAISLDTNQDGHGGGVLVSTVGKTALAGGASGTQLNVAVTRGRRKIVLSAVPDAGSAAALLQVREIFMYCTCWWYSLCNFQYRQHYEHTGSYNLDC